METIPFGPTEQQWDGYEGASAPGLPARSRRQFLGARTMIVIAAIVGGACFYAGVRVEKSQLPSTSAGSGLAAAARPSAATGRGATGAFPGVGGANATLGTVSSVSHGVLYVTDATGNTVKVSLSRATKVSKNVGVAKAAVRPGDTVVVQGVKSAKGTLVAASVSDTGARSSSSGSGRSSSGSGSASSAVNSLFGSGGGG